MITLQEWADDVLGRVIGDGQCVALCQDYSARVTGGGFLSTDGGRWPGYAGSIYDNVVSGRIPGYVAKSPASLAMPGWQAVWGESTFTPSTHIAVVMGDAGVGVDTMTQNPGEARRMIIPKIGLLGYIAPANNPDGFSIKPTGDIVSTTGNVISGINQIKDWVSNAGNWQRVGVYVLGALLILFALLYMFKSQAMSLAKEIV